MEKKLSILIPQYKEEEEVLKPLLDSIMVQQGVDLNDIEVIICNDGSDVKLSETFISSYPYSVSYYSNLEHGGVSKCRNNCLDRALGEYVMFCDADDMFLSVVGLYIILSEINKEPFNALVSMFVEELKDPNTGNILYLNHEHDSTFVHGKVYNRKYLIDNGIRWNDSLTVHEDSYFNMLCQALTKEAKYCEMPFYLWKWRNESVCRHDPKYILKTYNNMLDSSTALVNELLQRRLQAPASQICTQMIYDAYYLMNKKEWLDQENQSYRYDTEKRFKVYYNEFKILFNSIEEEVRNSIIVGVRNRFFQEGMFLESITFNDWIDHIQSLK